MLTVNTEVQKALAAVKANPPDDCSPLPWRSSGDKVRDNKGTHTPVAYCDSILDAAHIAAAVNSAPVLAAEVEKLQDVVGCIGVEQIVGGWKIMIGQSIGVGYTARDAIEAGVDAEVHRRLSAARVAVESLGYQSCQCGRNDLTEARRAVGLEG